MIRYVVSFYHDEAAYFLKPDLTDLIPENIVENVRRDCIMNAALYARNGLQNCSFWILGTFDDSTGLYNQEGRKELISQKNIMALVAKALGEIQNEPVTANPGNQG